MKKKLLYLFFLCMIVKIRAHSKDSTIHFKPFLIGIDLLSPLNIKLEKLISPNIGLAFRYHRLFPMRMVSSDADYNDSFLSELKIYPSSIKLETSSLYFGIYTKLRRSTSFSFVNKEGIRNNMLVGLNFGVISFVGKFYFEANFGGGLSLYAARDETLIPLDIRLNVTFGLPIYKKQNN